MTTLAEQISEQLKPLTLEERRKVLAEVRENLLDEKAHQLYKKYEKGELQAKDFDAHLADLEKRYEV